MPQPKESNQKRVVHLPNLHGGMEMMFGGGVLPGTDLLLNVAGRPASKSLLSLPGVGSEGMVSSTSRRRARTKKDVLSKEETETLLSKEPPLGRDTKDSGGDSYHRHHLYHHRSASSLQDNVFTLLPPESPANLPLNSPIHGNGLTSPIKGIGPYHRTKHYAHPVKFVGLSADNNLSPEPEPTTDDSEDTPSASPGMLKSLKELDNHDQLMRTTAAPPRERADSVELNMHSFSDNSVASSAVSSSLLMDTNVDNDVTVIDKTTTGGAANEEDRTGAHYLGDSNNPGAVDNAVTVIAPLNIDTCHD